MSDIVERLREGETHGVLIPCEDLKEAADEITRLRAELDAKRGEVELMTKALEWLRDVKGAHPENVCRVATDALSSTERPAVIRDMGRAKPHPFVDDDATPVPPQDNT